MDYERFKEGLHLLHFQKALKYGPVQNARSLQSIDFTGFVNSDPSEKWENDG